MPVPEGEGASILETDSYIVALVFLVFLALFVSFEKVRTVSGRPCRVVSNSSKASLLFAANRVATSESDSTTQSWTAGASPPHKAL